MVRVNTSAKFPAAKVVLADLALFTNDESTHLTQDVGTGDTTWHLDNVNNIAAEMRLSLLSDGGFEIVRVTAVDANAKTATVVRAQDGTVAVAHGQNQEVYATAPAQPLNQIVDELIGIEDWLGKDGDTIIWDRNLVLRPTTTDGTYPLSIEVLSGHADPEPFIQFRRSTDGGTSYTSAGSIDYDPANDELEVRNIVLTAAAGADILLEDDRSLFLGTDRDARFLYVSADDRVEYRSDKVLRFEKADESEALTLTPGTRLNLVGAFSIGGTDVFESDRDVAISLIPNADATLALGSAARTFNDLHVQTGTVYQGLIVNEDGGANDFRAESQDEVNMLLVAAAQNQVNVHTNFNADWGALNVGARNASNGTEVDMVATLGDSTDSATVQGNNQKAWGVRIGNPTLNSASGATTITDSAALYVPGPLQAGTDLTITNQYVALLEDGAGNKLFRFTAGGDYDIVSGVFQVGGTTVLEADRDLAIPLLPNADNTLNLGSAARQWAELRAVEAHISSFISLTGSTVAIEHIPGTGGTFTTLRARRNGDTFVRFSIDNDGRMDWGIGSAAQDVRLSRGAANRLDLAAGDHFQITSGDLRFDSETNGVILKDDAATPHYWRVTINSSGSLVTTDLGTSLPAT